MRRENSKTNNTNGTQPEIFHLTRSNQREVTASFDDPTLSTYGGQQLTLFNGYYGEMSANSDPTCAS